MTSAPAGLPRHLLMLVVVLVVVNWVTFTGVWWVQWAALGLAIAWILVVYRAAGAQWLTGRGAWWMKVALFVFAVVWLTTFIRAVRTALGR